MIIKTVTMAIRERIGYLIEVVIEGTATKSKILVTIMIGTEIGIGKRIERVMIVIVIGILTATMVGVAVIG